MRFKTINCFNEKITKKENQLKTKTKLRARSNNKIRCKKAKTNYCQAKTIKINIFTKKRNPINSKII